MKIDIVIIWVFDNCSLRMLVCRHALSIHLVSPPSLQKLVTLTRYLLNQFAQLSPINHSQCQRITAYGFICRMCVRFISFHYVECFAVEVVSAIKQIALCPVCSTLNYKIGIVKANSREFFMRKILWVSSCYEVSGKFLLKPSINICLTPPET